nr:hypothetical protein [Candidatus Dadabacteria bacterium]
LSIDNEPQWQINNINGSIDSDLGDTGGSDEIKLEINFPSLDSENQQGTEDRSSPNAGDRGDDKSGPQKLSDENTQELSQEDIELLRKLTIKE